MILAATTVLTFALILMLIASTIYSSRSQKRMEQALSGLEHSQRELGQLIGDLSDEVLGAVNENADLISRLQAATETSGDDAISPHTQA